MTRRAGRAGALGALLLASACARTPPPLPPPLPMEAAEVESLLAQQRDHAGSVRRYQGFVRVRGRGPEGGFDARLVVIFERPHRLRVELLGAFGATRWIAVAGESEITAYFPSRRQYLRESDVGEVVARLLGLRLEPGEVMAVLTGVGVPLEAPAAGLGQRRGGFAFLELDDSATLQIDGDGQVTAARTREYRVSYGTSWKSRRRQVPDELVLENDSIRATLTPEDVDVNVALAPDAFGLEVPEDAVRLRPAEVEGEAVFVITKDPGDPEAR